MKNFEGSIPVLCSLSFFKIDKNFSACFIGTIEQ